MHLSCALKENIVYKFSVKIFQDKLILAFLWKDKYFNIGLKYFFGLKLFEIKFNKMNCPFEEGKLAQKEKFEINAKQINSK